MFAPGYVLNGVYRVVRPPAHGGMALVYQVEHIQLGIHRALKVLQPKYSNDEECVARFKKEAQLMAHLRDPHIAQIHDFGVTDQGLLYLVMEWLDGEDLSQLRQRQPRQPLPFVLHLCRQVGAALTASHRVGVVHRDLKPANIFLCQSEPPREPDTLDHQEGGSFHRKPALYAPPSEPQCKVVDFGIAHLMGHFAGSGPSKHPHPPTRAGLMLGTPGYMAPEQILSALGSVGPYTDQFALAVIAYELLIGERLFVPEGRDIGALYGMAQRMMVGTLPPLPPEAEAAIGPALRRALHHQPEQRWPSVAQFVEALSQPSLDRLTQPLPRLQPSAHTPEPAESLRLSPAPRSTFGQRARWFGWLVGAMPLTVLVLVYWRRSVFFGPQPQPHLVLRATAEHKEHNRRPKVPAVIPPQAPIPDPVVTAPVKPSPVAKTCKRHALDIILEDDRSFGAQHHQWIATRKGVVRKCIDDLHLRSLVYSLPELVLRRSGTLIVANASFPPAKAKMLESCLENSLKPQWRPRTVRIRTTTSIDPHPCSNKAK